MRYCQKLWFSKDAGKRAWFEIDSVPENIGFFTLNNSILEVGAAAYHFGNAIQMSEMLSRIPADTIVFGNVDPAGQLRDGTPQSVKKATLDILNACGQHDNFVISSGCDIPPGAKWANIDAFFEAVQEYYATK